MQQTMILMAMWLIFTSAQLLRVALHASRRWLSTATLKPLTTFLDPGQQTHALVVALQEFQKTQVLFLLALQIVSLLALDHSSWLEAPTPMQVYYNAVFMMMLSTAGIYPIALGLTMLRRNKGDDKKDSTAARKDKDELEGLVLLLSLACIGVSSATWYRSSHIKLNAGQLQQEGINLEDCGDINPLRYCMGSGSSLASEGLTQDIFSRQWLSVGPLCVALYLTIEAALPPLVRHGLIPVPSWLKKVPQAAKHRLRNIPSWTWTFLNTLFILGIDAWLLLGNVLIFGNVYIIWKEPFDDGKVWTIGQVIGVAVWVPVFLEWIYVAICKSPFDYQNDRKEAG
jgi:hypothetical protein